MSICEERIIADNMLRLENQHPTETEKLLFEYLGLYLVEINEWTMKYAPVHTESAYKEFPVVIDNIEPKMIEWENSIVFDKMSETVYIKSYYDIDTISLVFNRMEELGFRKTFTNISDT